MFSLIFPAVLLTSLLMSRLLYNKCCSENRIPLDVSFIYPPVCPLILFFSECLLLSSNSGQSCWVKLVSLTDQPLPFYRGLSDCPTSVLPPFSCFLLEPKFELLVVEYSPPLSTTSAPYQFEWEPRCIVFSHTPLPSKPFCKYGLKDMPSDLLFKKWGGLHFSLSTSTTPPTTPLSLYWPKINTELESLCFFVLIYDFTYILWPLGSLVNVSVGFILMAVTVLWLKHVFFPFWIAEQMLKVPHQRKGSSTCSLGESSGLTMV